MKNILYIVPLLLAAIGMGSEFDEDIYLEHLSEYEDMVYEDLVDLAEQGEVIGLMGQAHDKEQSAAYFRRLHQLRSELVANGDVQLARRARDIVHRLWRDYPDHPVVMYLRTSYEGPPFGLFSNARYAVKFYGLNKINERSSIEVLDGHGQVTSWTVLFYGMVRDYLMLRETEELNDEQYEYSRGMYLFSLDSKRPTNADFNLWVNVIEKYIQSNPAKQESWHQVMQGLLARAEKLGYEYRQMEALEFEMDLEMLIQQYQSYYSSFSPHPESRGALRGGVQAGRDVAADEDNGVEHNQKMRFAEGLAAVIVVLMDEVEDSGMVWSWDRHMRMVDQQLRTPSLRGQNRYIPALLGETFGLEVEVLTKCAEIYYLLKKSGLSVGNVGPYADDALAKLGRLSPPDREQLNELLPGLLNALLAVAHAMKGDEQQSAHYRRRAERSDQEWGSFIDENTIIWERQEQER